jgi:CDP-paratose 2-epimerase
MHVFITGICGFVGSALARWFLQQDSAIRISGLDNFIRPGSETNRPLLQKMGVDIRHGDVRNASDFEALPAADWVIDAAANPSVLAGVDGKISSRQLVEHNLLGTLNILEYCKRSKAGFILPSTSRVYSIRTLTALPMRARNGAFELEENNPLPPGVSRRGIAENVSTAAPISLYGSTKLASESLALEYGEAFGFPVWINRCGVLAGAGQFGTAEQGIFSFWIHAYARRRPLRYIGFDGTGWQIRDAFHPDDLAALLWKQMHFPKKPEQRIFNVGGGAANAMSLAQLSAWCGERFGSHPVMADMRPRPFDIPWMIMDATMAERAFGWAIERPLSMIVEQIADQAQKDACWLEASGA